jgi:transportin-3
MSVPPLKWSPYSNQNFQEIYPMVISLESPLPLLTHLSVLEDYLNFLLPLLDMAPDLFFQSTAFPRAFRCAMAGLTVIHTDIVLSSLDIFRSILGHDCLNRGPLQPPKFVTYANAIGASVEQCGFELVGLLLSGMTGDYEEAAISAVVSIMRSLFLHWTPQVTAWLPTVLQQLPGKAISNDVKTQFLSDITR